MQENRSKQRRQPAQVVSQILGGDPVEAIHSPFHDAIVGIADLEMNGRHLPRPGLKYTNQDFAIFRNVASATMRPPRGKDIQQLRISL